MLYQVSDVTQNGVRDTHFVPERIDLLGGIDYICLEVWTPGLSLCGLEWFFNTPVLRSQKQDHMKCIIFPVDKGTCYYYVGYPCLSVTVFLHS